MTMTSGRSCRRRSSEARRREAGRARSWACCSPRGAQRWEGRRSSPLRCPASSDRRRDRFASGSPIMPPLLRQAGPSSRPSPRSGTGPRSPRCPGSTAAGIAMAVKLIEAPGTLARRRRTPTSARSPAPGPASNAASPLNATPCSRPSKPPAAPLFSRPPRRINPPATPRNDLHSRVLTIAPGWRPPAARSKRPRELDLRRLRGLPGRLEVDLLAGQRVDLGVHDSPSGAAR